MTHFSRHIKVDGNLDSGEYTIREIPYLPIECRLMRRSQQRDLGYYPLVVENEEARHAFILPDGTLTKDFDPRTEIQLPDKYIFTPTYVVKYRDKEPKTEEQIQETLQAECENLIQEIRRIKEEKIKEGFAFIFSDGPGVVITKEDWNIRDIHTNTSTATVLCMKGLTSQPMKIKDRDDFQHNITSQEMIHFGLALADHGQLIYDACWKHEEDIKKITTYEEFDNYQNCLELHWPDQIFPIDTGEEDADIL